MQIVSIIYQALFSGKKKRKNILNLSSDELVQRLVKVNERDSSLYINILRHN